MLPAIAFGFQFALTSLCPHSAPFAQDGANWSAPVSLALVIKQSGELWCLADFRRAVEEYQRRSNTNQIVFTALRAIWIFVYVALAVPYQALLSSRFNELWTDLLMTLPLIIPVGILLVIGVALGRRIERTWGVSCRFSGAPPGNHKRIVIASRNCPNCGQRVIQEEG